MGAFVLTEDGYEEQDPKPHPSLNDPAINQAGDLGATLEAGGWNVPDIQPGLSVITDTDPAANTVLDDAEVGDYAGITLAASHTGYDVTLSLSDDAGGLFALEAVTNRVLVASALTVGSHVISVLAESSDGVSTRTRGFMVVVTEADVDPPDDGPMLDFSIATNSQYLAFI